MVKTGELNVKVNVDVSEAITGLKALQREARKATQALAELDDKARRGTFAKGDVIRWDGVRHTVIAADQEYAILALQSGITTDLTALFVVSNDPSLFNVIEKRVTFEDGVCR